MRELAVLVLLSLVASGLARTLCKTPNGKNGLCESIRRCPVLRRAYSNPSKEVQRFLRESECSYGYNNSPGVCCGSVARFQSSKSITARPPPKITPARMVKASTANSKKHKNFGLLPMGGACGVQNAVENIYGGNETNLNEFPWMALLEYRKDGQSTGHQCGGMLITDRYVLTAAHCVKGQIEAIGDLYQIRLGEHDSRTPIDCRLKTEGSEEYEDCAETHHDIQVTEVIPHSNYNLTGDEFNDIALVRLARPAPLQDNIRPICLPVNGEASAVGAELHVAGWGQINANTFSSPVKLKTIVSKVSLEQCNNTYTAARRPLTDMQLCAGGIEGIDSCKGDSGGPVMSSIPGVTPPRWYVEGIVSFGRIPCGFPGWPGVYTKVASYINWILDNMKS